MGGISKDEEEGQEGRRREEERKEGKYGMVRITRAGRGGTEKKAKGGDGGSNAREIDIVLEGEGRGIRYDICIDKRRVVRRVRQDRYIA
jgi:hypothetical protein